MIAMHTTCDSALRSHVNFFYTARERKHIPAIKRVNRVDLPRSFRQNIQYTKSPDSIVPYLCSRRLFAQGSTPLVPHQERISVDTAPSAVHRYSSCSNDRHRWRIVYIRLHDRQGTRSTDGRIRRWRILGHRARPKGRRRANSDYRPATSNRARGLLAKHSVSWLARIGCRSILRASETARIRADLLSSCLRLRALRPEGKEDEGLSIGRSVRTWR
ncbi:hypothetical protein EJ02DRAFT_198831 [Clathrospora elynae]|uniref:Uncharacterized protein n=1 Tax=Clathrospora elynae TaxID=706981 RepID=A0A6A5T2Q0_9PLEO|nr:hypothetical protein EJ02DRAFT_198831 [Clathrospora elynae]